MMMRQDLSAPLNKQLMKNYFTIIFTLMLSQSFAQGKFFGGNGDGFAVSQSAMILPVNLVNFEASLQQDKAQISWTAVSDNISLFVLEISSDGNFFEWLAEKTVTPNTIAPVRYGYADISRTGLWYYRLKWHEANGVVKHSKTISVLFPAVEKLQAIYDAGAATLTVSKPADISLITIYSADGRLQKTVRNAQSVCRIPVRDLPAGLYIVKISGNTFVSRFLKL
jgi:hypothetical protein